jgi:hypothetical protein
LLSVLSQQPNAHRLALKSLHVAAGLYGNIPMKDRPQAPSKLHEFLEDIGLSRVDAHMVCGVTQKGKSISSLFAPK